MNSTRREFLSRSVGATTLLASGTSLPGFLARTARAAADTPAIDDRIFVVVQMSGGNDGLNTVIPHRDDAYHKARPTLATHSESAFDLNDELRLHQAMAGFKRLFDDGLLHVIGNVGYPNPDRSHFRSMDIWHTASTQPENARDGWLGRLAERQRAKSTEPPVLHLDDGEVPLAVRAEGLAVPSIRGIDAVRLAAGADEIESAIALARESATDDLLFLQRTALSSCANARRLEQVAGAGGSAHEYPYHGLANRLKQIAQLIGADFGPRVYYTSLGGFDTHARQADSHSRLLRELSDSVAAFFADLKQRRLAERVVLMTFSEFGRRVMENGSRGTDHGAAAPMFVVGPACKPGLSGGLPDLSDLADGDVRYHIDFRRVYAALLRDWLGVPPAAILGGEYEPLDLIQKRG